MLFGGEAKMRNTFNINKSGKSVNGCAEVRYVAPAYISNFCPLYIKTI